LADAGYQGAADWSGAIEVNRHMAIRPAKRRAMDKNPPVVSLLDGAEQMTASVRTTAKHPFRLIKCQFGFPKALYKGLAKKPAPPATLSALSNFWLVRKRIIRTARMCVRPHHGPRPAQGLRGLINHTKPPRIYVKTRVILHQMNF